MRHAIAFALTIRFLCLVANAYGDDTPAPSIRQPEVRDWRVFHQKNDEYWARQVTVTAGRRTDSMPNSKIRVTASEIRRMRILAGVPDDFPADALLKVIGRGMKTDDYVFETLKSDSCLKVSVIHNGWKLTQLWSIDKLPNGSGICRLPGCGEPQISVESNHEIRVRNFSHSTPATPFCDQYNDVSYVPQGDSYELKQQKAGTVRCFRSDARWRGLNFAIRQAAGPGETLAIVENLPALSRDRYALVFQKRTNGIDVLRMRWKDADLPAFEEHSAAECFESAKSTSVVVKTLKFSEERVTSLLDRLRQIDLRSDRCFRNSDQQCAMILDGRRFSVQVGDDPPILLTDVNGLRGYTSENLELSAWVYRLLDEAGHAHDTDGNQH